jgi:hypothetical protein
VDEGETFFFPESNAHLWIVASNPAKDLQNVLLVNVTTYDPADRFKENACLLSHGDHAFIKHCSCINYADSRVFTDAHLTSLLARGRIKLQDKLDPAVLKRVRDGASLSKRIPLKNLQILMEQED